MPLIEDLLTYRPVGFGKKKSFSILTLNSNVTSAACNLMSRLSVCVVHHHHHHHHVPEGLGVFPVP